VSWVKLDDGFADHPKVLAVSGDAVLLHLAGFCYCARQETDGAIPELALSQLTRFSKPKAAKLAARLVEVGLWERNGAGWLVHDYLDYNPSRESLKERRGWARERTRVDRAAIIKRDGMVCGICGGDILYVADIDIDHIIPVSRGGTSGPDNLQVAHRGCNLRKGAGD